MNNPSTTSVKTLWETALGQLQLQVPRPSYDTWLKGTVGLSLENGQLTIGAPSSFAAEWLERRMYQLIQKTVAGVTAEPVQVRITVFPGTRTNGGGNGQKTEDHAPLVPLRDGPIDAPPGLATMTRSLNHRYTFQNFVQGSCNQLAFAAARAVAEHPGTQFNPLFIYSGVGLGKTHLLQAIASCVAQNGLSPLYVTTEHFTNDFVRSIRERKVEDFRAKYRSSDVLLLDDIQFLAGKEQTQEGFFHTFNDLHNAGRQIVVACDSSPRAVALLEDRLRSRFEWGLIVDLQPPDLETRIAILQEKAQAGGIQISMEVAGEIAMRASHNVRDLEGSLNRVLALSQFRDIPISVDLVRTALADLPIADRFSSLSPAKVVDNVAEYFHVSTGEIRTRRRDRKTTHPQRIAMYILSEFLNEPLSQIGTLLGNWNTKTVRNCLAQVSANLKNDPAAQVETDAVLQTLGIPAN